MKNEERDFELEFSAGDYPTPKGLKHEQRDVNVCYL